jgi:hypothetical protein
LGLEREHRRSEEDIRLGYVGAEGAAHDCCSLRQAAEQVDCES